MQTDRTLRVSKIGFQRQSTTTATRAVREYLETLDGAASPVKPKHTSQSDPAAQWTGAHGGPAYFAYSANYLLDTDNAIILDVDATRAIRQAEVRPVQIMIDRLKQTHGMIPQRLIADTAYGTGPMLEWLIAERGIVLHIPVIDKSARKDGTFERADFTFDGQGDRYICPGGKEFKQYHRALTPNCCPKEPTRKVTRTISESSRDEARRLAHTREYAISRKLRKKVEVSFAHLKRIHGLGRLRLRGPCGANDEFLLAATVPNLKKRAKLIPTLKTTTPV